MRESEDEQASKREFSIHSFAPQCLVRTGAELIQEPSTPLRSPTWVTGAQAFEHHLLWPGASTGVTSRTVRTQTSTPVWTMGVPSSLTHRVQCLLQKRFQKVLIVMLFTTAWDYSVDPECDKRCYENAYYEKTMHRLQKMFTPKINSPQLVTARTQRCCYTALTRIRNQLGERLLIFSGFCEWHELEVIFLPVTLTLSPSDHNIRLPLLGGR